MTKDSYKERRRVLIIITEVPSVVEGNGDIISKARTAVTEETIKDWFKNLRENLHKEDVEEERKESRKRKSEDKKKLRLSVPKRDRKKKSSYNISHTSTPTENDSEKSDNEYDDAGHKIHDQKNQAQYEVNYFIIVRYAKKYVPDKIIHAEDEQYEVRTVVESEKGKVWKWPKLRDN
ncbi:hypothetical protein FQR65_LT13533 [Abscondita terminalis]|nr:hypothetical protein FQR65_LT13533 [Abscondita terminalis]